MEVWWWWCVCVCVCVCAGRPGQEAGREGSRGEGQHDTDWPERGARPQQRSCSSSSSIAGRTQGWAVAMAGHAPVQERCWLAEIVMWSEWLSGIDSAWCTAAGGGRGGGGAGHEAGWKVGRLRASGQSDARQPGAPRRPWLGQELHAPVAASTAAPPCPTPHIHISTHTATTPTPTPQRPPVPRGMYSMSPGSSTTSITHSPSSSSLKSRLLYLQHGTAMRGSTTTSACRCSLCMAGTALAQHAQAVTSRGAGRAGGGRGMMVARRRGEEAAPCPPSASQLRTAAGRALGRWVRAGATASCPPAAAQRHLCRPCGTVRQRGHNGRDARQRCGRMPSSWAR